MENIMLREKALERLRQEALNGRRCIDCEEKKPLETFYPYKRGGFQVYCKSCASKRANAWLIINPERKRAAQHRHYLKTKAAKSEYSKRRREARSETERNAERAKRQAQRAARTSEQIIREREYQRIYQTAKREKNRDPFREQRQAGLQMLLDDRAWDADEPLGRGAFL